MGHSWRILLRSMTCVLVALISTHAVARPVRTPGKDWTRHELGPDTQTVIFRNLQRGVAMSAALADAPPNGENVSHLIEALAGSRIFSVRRMWRQEKLAEDKIQSGFSLTMPDGSIAAYVAIWRVRRDGRYAISSYLTTNMKDPENSIKDFTLARALNNQLVRGATPGYVPEVQFAAASVPAPAPAPPPAPTKVPRPAGDLAVKNVLFPKSPPSPPTSQPVIEVVEIPANVSTAQPAPFVKPPSKTAALPAAIPSAGIGTKPIAALLYTPNEYSELYVLFKDGSFHENLPAALEDWDVGASRRSEPDSWGKWKKASKAGEYDVTYGSDDKQTIAGVKVEPSAPGRLLEGTYATEARAGQPAGRKSEISFSGEQFRLAEGQENRAGRYRIEGYSITLAFSDGQTQRRTFFMVPKTEDDDNQAIWFGDGVKVKKD